MSRQTVLVTGGTGFLGAYIIDELIRNGFAVRGLRRATSKLPDYISADIFNQVEWVEGDVLDVMSLEEAMDGVDAVIHSAARVSFAPAHRKEMYRVNVDGTANVVNIALEKNISRLVHVSSVAALGRKGDGQVVTEDTKWEDNKLNTHYAKSKYKGELEVWRAIGEGLNAVIVNPSTILGYGDWNSGSSGIFQKVYKEFQWYTPGLNGFVDVRDAARAIVQLMQTGITEQRFIINGDNWEFRQLMNTMADAFGKKRPTKSSTPFMIGLAWRLEKMRSWISGQPPFLTRESARVAFSKTRFDNSKVLNALGGFKFTPLDISIQNAATQYLAALKRP